MRLTEEHVEEALREIGSHCSKAHQPQLPGRQGFHRPSNSDKATDQAVLKSLSPVQQVVKIVRDELLALFGDAGKVD